MRASHMRLAAAAVLLAALPLSAANSAGVAPALRATPSAVRGAGGFSHPAFAPPPGRQWQGGGWRRSALGLGAVTGVYAVAPRADANEEPSAPAGAVIAPVSVSIWIAAPASGPKIVELSATRVSRRFHLPVIVYGDPW